jgi:3'-phosphoadenosine 5'-phosphosulfate sulfotransferase (PAPS reductase)/FAD synthetase/intein/homing endonuclease
LYLCKKAFFGKVPFPAIHIDNGQDFPETYAFRDKIVKEWGVNLLIAKAERYKDHISGTGEGLNKAEALKKLMAEKKFDALIVSIRRDEHGIRSKERTFSPRDKDWRWDFQNQPPEIFNYVSDFKEASHVRVHPLLHWTECMPKGHLVITNPGVKDISEVKIGDIVLGHDGNYHSVINTFSRNYEGDLIEIIPYNLLPIKVTEDHPIYVAKLRRCENNVYCAPTCYNLKKCVEIRKKSEERLMNYNLALILYENGKTIKTISKSLKINQGMLWEWLYNKKRKIRYRIIDKPYFLNYKPQWISAGDITKDYYVLVPYPKSRKDINEITLPNGKKIILTGRNQGRLLRLCGYYVAEGFIIKNRYGPVGIGFGFGPEELSLVKEADNCIRKVFNLSTTRHKHETGIDLRFYSKEIAEFFVQNFGDGAENKRIPKFIMDLKPEKLRSFLRACIKGDGCGYKKRGILNYNYTTISKQLIFQIFLLFTKFGIIPSIAVRKNNNIIKGKKYHTDPIYVLNSSSSPKTAQIMREKESIPKRKVRKRGFFWQGFCWLPIRQVKRRPFKGIVYNLEVEEVNSYTSNLIAVHNCDVWMYTKEKNIPFNPLYLAKNGKRYRSLGYPEATVPIESNADTIDKIIEELKTTQVAERSGRSLDKEKEYVMQRLRELGYMAVILVPFLVSFGLMV